MPQRTAAAAQQAPEAPSRFRLIGVMAPRAPAEQAEPGSGIALIAVDGKPAKPYPVGARLDSDLVLQSVGLRTASLGPAQGARSVLLELPALPPPHSGVPPGVGSVAPVSPAAPVRMMPPGMPPPPAPAVTGGAAIDEAPLLPTTTQPPQVPPALPTDRAPSEKARLLRQ